MFHVCCGRDSAYCSMQAWLTWVLFLNCGIPVLGRLTGCPLGNTFEPLKRRISAPPHNLAGASSDGRIMKPRSLRNPTGQSSLQPPACSHHSVEILSLPAKNSSRGLSEEATFRTLASANDGGKRQSGRRLQAISDLIARICHAAPRHQDAYRPRPLNALLSMR